MHRLASALILLGLSGPVAAVDLPLPQGARLLTQEISELDSYALPTGPHDGAIVPAKAMEGRITREAWRLDTESVTNLQIIQPVRDTLVAEGFEVLLDCNAQSCGGFEFRFEIEVLAAPNMFVDLTDYHFLSAHGPEGSVALLVSGTTTARFVQVIRVGEASRAEVVTTVAPGLPVVVTSELGAKLEAAGRVVLDDLSFETGSATLSEGPYATLDALAEYLLSNSNRQIALVGHTDAVGGLDGNIALSRRRAQAVLERLATRYEVPRGQMEAGGMGYLSPRATNLTDEGRTANRRVEAVLTSTE